MTYDRENIFAKIIRGEIPCKKVYEDDSVLAFEDVAPVAPVHILVVPKGDYISFDDFIVKASAEEVDYFFKTVRKIAHEQGVGNSGYRIIMNHGRDACQSVAHFHVHILGNRFMGGLLAGDKLER